MQIKHLTTVLIVTISMLLLNSFWMILNVIQINNDNVISPLLDKYILETLHLQLGVELFLIIVIIGAYIIKEIKKDIILYSL